MNEHIIAYLEELFNEEEDYYEAGRIVEKVKAEVRCQVQEISANR